MFLPKLPPLELSTAPAGSGFFAARSGRQNRPLSRAERAANKLFWEKAKQATVFDVRPVQLPLFAVNTPSPQSGIKKYGSLCNTRTLYPMGENSC